MRKEGFGAFVSLDWLLVLSDSQPRRRDYGRPPATSDVVTTHCVVTCIKGLGGSLRIQPNITCLIKGFRCKASHKRPRRRIGVDTPNEGAK